MSKQHYHQQLSTLIDNALLHLYSQVAISHRFVPTAKRNTLLCQFLKPKIKQPQHKAIKGDIKRMVIAGQKADANLELRLEELRKMANDYKASVNDAQRLYDLLNILFDEHGFDSRLFKEDEQTEPEIIYVLLDHLEHCFEYDGKQTAPVSLLIEFKKIHQIHSSPSLIKLAFLLQHYTNTIVKQSKRIYNYTPITISDTVTTDSTFLFPLGIMTSALSIK